MFDYIPFPVFNAYDTKIYKYHLPLIARIAQLV